MQHKGAFPALPEAAQAVRGHVSKARGCLGAWLRFLRPEHEQPKKRRASACGCSGAGVPRRGAPNTNNQKRRKQCVGASARSHAGGTGASVRRVGAWMRFQVVNQKSGAVRVCGRVGAWANGRLGGCAGASPAL